PCPKDVRCVNISGIRVLISPRLLMNHRNRIFRNLMNCLNGIFAWHGGDNLVIPTFADPEDDERQTPVAVVGALRAGPTAEARPGLCEEGMKPIGYLLKRVQHSLRLAM